MSKTKDKLAPDRSPPNRDRETDMEGADNMDGVIERKRVAFATQPGGAMIPAKLPTEIVVPVNQLVLPMPDGTTQRIMTSYNPSDPKDAAGILSAAAASDKDLRDMLGVVFGVEHFLIHPASTIKPETGEVVNFLQTIFVSADGTRHATASDWVIATLMLAIVLYGKPPWKPERKFTLKSRTTSNKRTMFYLDPARE